MEIKRNINFVPGGKVGFIQTNEDENGAPGQSYDAEQQNMPLMGGGAQSNQLGQPQFENKGGYIMIGLCYVSNESID